MGSEPPALVALGRVASVAPGKREARAKIAQGLTLDEAALGWAWFEQGGGWARYRVVKAAAGAGELRLVFAAGVPMDTVRGLMGAGVAVAPEVVVSRGPLWQRVREMVDLDALSADGARIGRVVAAYEGPHTGAIKVESDNGTAWVIPVIDETVRALDVARGAVILGDFQPYAVEAADDAD